MRSRLPTNLLVLIFTASTLFPIAAIAADWNAVGGTIPDAAWSGDTPALTGENNVGALTGEGDVSGGAATYSIPINVVPGRSGMQPNVSLNYSSNRGNGIAGVGWGLSATSSISRCGKTTAQDGITDRVHFLKSKDRLCLNGQRLVAHSGAYGNTATEYRTEIDSFVKVEQFGDMDGTSTYFTVTYKSGVVDTYGGTADSRHSPLGVTKTSSWMISKSADVSGKNTIDYYYSSLGYGEYKLDKISYTGQDSTPGDRHVEFAYEVRPDTSNGYRSGGSTSSTIRLKTITTKYQTQLVRQYRLTYKLSLTSGNSLLDYAEECGYVGATAHCLPATQFNWYENTPTYKLDRLHYVQANGQKGFLAELAKISGVLPKKDMNGDGSLDWSSVFLNAEGQFKANNTYENLGGCQLNHSTWQTRCHNADFNQDGLTDSWKVTGSGSIKTFYYAYANYDGSAPVLTASSITLDYLTTLGESVLGIADLNGDGYSDVVVRRGVVHSTSFTGTADVEVFLHTQNDLAPYPSTGIFVYSIPARRSSITTWTLDEDVQLLGDFDGNGLEDVFVFIKDASTDEFEQYFAPQWHKPKFTKALLSQPQASGYSSVLHDYGAGTVPAFPSPVPAYINHDILFDINGDGLLDVMGLIIGTSFGYKINLGNGELSGWLFLANSATMGAKLKKGFVPVTRDPAASGGPFSLTETYYEPRLVPGFVLDHDQNGQPEMLIPHTRVVSFCYDVPIVTTSSAVWTIETLCDDDMYRIGELASAPQPPLPDNHDRSIWEYHKAEFTITGHTAEGLPLVSVALVPTDLVATISDAATADIYGNGHNDFLTMITCNSGDNCSYGDPAGNNDLNDYSDSYGQPLTTGPYMNRNAGSYGATSSDLSDYEVVDKMKSATDAFGTSVEWDYLPLNSGKAGDDFYDVDQSHLGTTPGYLHFSANISVVNQVRHSDGIGGLRAYDYKYRDATLSSQGRGFLGYEQIIVDDIANNLRSVSDYHIKFPLAGEVAERRRCVISSSNLDCASLPISQTVNTYGLWRDGILKQTILDDTTNYATHILENSSVDNRYWVSPKTQTDTQYQTSSSHSAGTGALQPITVSSSWTHQTIGEQTFNANSCQTFSRSTYQEPASANNSVSETTTALYGANTGSWWLCKTDYQSTLTKSVTGRTGDYATIESGSDAQKTLKTTTTWNTTHRKPVTVTAEATQGGGKPTRTTMTYNTHGLLTSVKIEGTNYNGSSYAMSNRDTTSTYSADGYFLGTVTNDKSHVTTTIVDAKYGAPTQVTDPNGQVTTMTYDHFGRQLSSKAPGEPTVWTASWWCSGINGGAQWCPNYEPIRYKVTRRSTGTPDVYRYFDGLKREADSLVRNFANSNWNRTLNRFDSRGLQVYVTNSFSNLDWSTAKYTNFDGYDNLGRLTRKRSPQANDTNLQTSYAYTGQTVDITAQSSGIGAKTLYMSRKLNGLGQLVTTTDADNNDTEYAYDGSGNSIALADPDDNTITTSFNALGQKIWVHDPNAGDTDFLYNSLGELEWQQDADGDVLTYQYDDLGRIYNRWTNGTYSGIWRYDNPNTTWGRKGMIDYEYNTTTTTDRLTKYYRYARTSGGKDYLYYNWHYIYENGSLPGENKHLTYYHVDNNFGRPKGVHYRSDLKTVYEYNSPGYMTHIKNASSGYVYREVTDLDALGNITGSTMGNGVLTQAQAHHVATGQMTQNLVTKTSGGNTIHELEYDYDGFGNLYQSQVTASNSLQNYETFTYDNLHRLTDSDRAYSSESRPNDAINYAYNQLGNITLKDDYLSSASYGNAAKSLGGNAGPNAIRQITYAGGGTTNYTYDDNGNMLTGDGRTMTYNEFNKPLTIAKGGVTSTFSYGANLLRYKQIKTGLTGGTQTTYHVDRLMEIERQGTRTTYRHYIDGVAVLNKEVDGATTTWKLGFHLKDRLGSVVTLADQDGAVLEHRSYDPFGKPRRGDFIDATAGTIQAAIAEDPHPEDDLDPLTDRGFTDHEHLDEQQVIHMNGRVFDYNIGRFSSVDPYIQYPYLSQSLNPYSYIMNNPLAGTDPSGYLGIGEKLRRVDELHDPTYERNPYAFGSSDGGEDGGNKQTGSNLNRKSLSVSSKVSAGNGGQRGGGSREVRSIGPDGGGMKDGSVQFEGGNVERRSEDSPEISEQKSQVVQAASVDWESPDESRKQFSGQLFETEPGEPAGVNVTGVASDMKITIVAGDGKGSTRVILIINDRQFDPDTGEFRTSERKFGPKRMRAGSSRDFNVRTPKDMRDRDERSVSIIATADKLPIKVRGSFAVIQHRTMMASDSSASDESRE